MKRYLIVEHFLYGTSTVDEISKKDLAERLQDESKHIFDLQNGTEFNPDKNQWVPVKIERMVTT